MSVTWAGTDLGVVVVVVVGVSKEGVGAGVSARLKEAKKISGNSPFAPKREKKNQQQPIIASFQLSHPHRASVGRRGRSKLQFYSCRGKNS